MKLRVKMPEGANSSFSGRLYGLEFIKGLSEVITEKNLYERLVSRGYMDASEKEAEEPKKGKK